jgi:hypothetical protein
MHADQFVASIVAEYFVLYVVPVFALQGCGYAGIPRAGFDWL